MVPNQPQSQWLFGFLFLYFCFGKDFYFSFFCISLSLSAPPPFSGQRRSRSQTVFSAPSSGRLCPSCPNCLAMAPGRVSWAPKVKLADMLKTRKQQKGKEKRNIFFFWGGGVPRLVVIRVWCALTDYNIVPETRRGVVVVHLTRKSLLSEKGYKKTNKCINRRIDR